MPGIRGLKELQRAESARLMPKLYPDAAAVEEVTVYVPKADLDAARGEEKPYVFGRLGILFYPADPDVDGDAGSVVGHVVKVEET